MACPARIVASWSAAVNFELYYDPSIGQTHVEAHHVSEGELHEFFTEILYLEGARSDGSFVAIGKLGSGRYLEVAYRKKRKDLYFVITAYDLEDRERIDILEKHLEP